MTYARAAGPDYRNVSTGQGSWTLTAGVVGNVRIVHTMILTSGVTVSSMSGGGVTTWNDGGHFVASGPNSQFGTNCVFHMYWGAITSTGTALTINYSGTIGGTNIRQHKTDFSSTRASNWRFDGYNNSDSTSGTTITCGSIKVGRWDSVYYAYAWCGGTPTAGSTPGFTYAVDTNTNYEVYLGGASADQTAAPTLTQTSAGYSTNAITLNDGYEWPTPIVTTPQHIRRPSLY